MVEVFITNIAYHPQASRVVRILEEQFPSLQFSMDVEYTEIAYPCVHSILRVEGLFIPTESVQHAVHQSGFLCDILEDKICKKILLP